MPPAYVKPYVKLGKPDVAGAEATSEAVTRPVQTTLEDSCSGSCRAQIARLKLHREIEFRRRQRRREADGPLQVATLIITASRPVD